MRNEGGGGVMGMGMIPDPHGSGVERGGGNPNARDVSTRGNFE
jgi:hypothetical protein